MSEKKIVEFECLDCSGTGLYCGFAESEGEAVVCLSCNGTGKRTIEYTPFTGRKEKEGIRWVSLSRGSFIGTGVGSIGKKISYEDFKCGKLKY